MGSVLVSNGGMYNVLYRNNFYNHRCFVMINVNVGMCPLGGKFSSRVGSVTNAIFSVPSGRGATRLYTEIVSGIFCRCGDLGDLRFLGACHGGDYILSGAIDVVSRNRIVGYNGILGVSSGYGLVMGLRGNRVGTLSDNRIDVVHGSWFMVHGFNVCGGCNYRVQRPCFLFNWVEVCYVGNLAIVEGPYPATY